MSQVPIDKRKEEHLDIFLTQDVLSRRFSGWDQVHLSHNALPEADYKKMDLSVSFLGYTLPTPLFISCMTGGTERATEINRRLASVAERERIPMGVGSMRVALEKKEWLSSFQLKKVTPQLILLANMGAIQLNYGVTITDCLYLAEEIEADGFVLHLNPLQELLQGEGNKNWKGILCKIEALARALPIPLIIKEVGWGLSTSVAQKLWDVGVKILDVAGAGGTSWSRIEMLRTLDKREREVSSVFDDWGIRTIDAIQSIYQWKKEITILASGGIVNGVEGAKAIALGAHLFGITTPLLKSACKSEEELESKIFVILKQLRIALFCSGYYSMQQYRGSIAHQ